MITITPIQQFEFLRYQKDPKEFERDRRREGWNFAQAAKAHGVSVREWAMLECGTTPEELACGQYPKKTGRIPGYKK